MSKRHENGVRARIAAAHFPVIKTIESFDFALQPQLPKAKFLELFDCAFVEQHRNVICIESTRYGKNALLVGAWISRVYTRLSGPLRHRRRTAHGFNRGKA